MVVLQVRDQVVEVKLFDYGGKKEDFLTDALFFLLVLLWFIVDVSKKTTFPGGNKNDQVNQN